jgi:hypothetical protein
MSLKIEQLHQSQQCGREKTRGEKMKASAIMLLKTQEAKMPFSP